MQEGSVLHLCIKFEADMSSYSEVIRESQILEIWSRDPGHTHLGPHAAGVIPLCLYQI